MKIKYPILVFILTVFTFISCMDEPNSTGNLLIPGKDKLSYKKIDSYTSQFNQTFSSFQKDSLYLGSSSRVLLGNYKNITSEILIRFLISLPDSIKDPLDSNKITVKSAWIEMQPNYWIGDSNGLRFTVHEIKESWNSINITLDTINAVRATLGANILDDNTFIVNDSTIKFNIDTKVAENWAMETFDDTYPENRGLFLTPTTNNSLAGFQALASYPKTKYIYLFTEFEKEGGFIDTVKSEPNADLHWITGERLPEPPRRVLLQSSTGVRGKLWFDISQVPANIILNSVQLKLFVDNNNTFQGSVPADSIAVHYLKDSNELTVNTDYGKYPLLRNGELYSGDIRKFVQRWIDGEENHGMEIKLTDEVRSASTVTFYGSDSEIDSLKPRLTIYYTSK